MTRIVIFGGTSEGRELSEHAAALGLACDVYVATPTGAEYLEGLAVTVHIGRLDTAAMAEELRRLAPASVLDATHPYAAEASRNIRAACEQTGYRCLRIVRAELPEQGDRQVADAAEAAELLRREYAGAPVLLTTGSKELSAFAGLAESGAEIYARILPGEENAARARAAGIGAERIVLGHGPYTEEENYRLLRRYGIRCLVTKASGARGGYAEKLRAARRAGCAVIVIARPEAETGIEMEEALRLLEEMANG